MALQRLGESSSSLLSLLWGVFGRNTPFLHLACTHALCCSSTERCNPSPASPWDDLGGTWDGFGQENVCLLPACRNPPGLACRRHCTPLRTASSVGPVPPSAPQLSAGQAEGPSWDGCLCFADDHGVGLPIDKETVQLRMFLLELGAAEAW